MTSPAFRLPFESVTTANPVASAVAAEYVVPVEFWDPTHDDFDKPHLLGQLYHYAPGPNRYGGGPFYELHVWAAKHNPRGPFADWNPNVSCGGSDGLSSGSYPLNQ